MSGSSMSVNQSGFCGLRSVRARPTNQATAPTAMQAALERSLVLSIFVLVVAWILRRVYGGSLINPSEVSLAWQRADMSMDRHANDAPMAAVGHLTPNQALRAIDDSYDAHAVDAPPRDASLAELGELLRLAGTNPSEAEVEQYRAQLRSAGVQSISPEVLTAIVEQYYEEHPPANAVADLEESWRVIDTDGDNVISSKTGEMANLIEMLTTVGEPLTDEETEEFIQDIDADRDGEISKAEFMAVLGE